MSIYVALKIIHVLAAIVALGANVTYAFWLRRAGHDRDRLVWTIQGVRRLDNIVANPAYGVLLVTGIALVVTGVWSFSEFWISAAFALYFVTALLGIFVYGPSLRRQIAEAEADPTSEAYAAASRRSNILGIVTTLIVVVIVILMVAKPGA